jgi:hypothetical protein
MDRLSGQNSNKPGESSSGRTYDMFRQAEQRGTSRPRSAFQPTSDSQANLSVTSRIEARLSDYRAAGWNNYEEALAKIFTEPEFAPLRDQHEKEQRYRPKAAYRSLAEYRARAEEGANIKRPSTTTLSAFHFPSQSDTLQEVSVPMPYGSGIYAKRMRRGIQELLDNRWTIDEKAACVHIYKNYLGDVDKRAYRQEINAALGIEPAPGIPKDLREVKKAERERTEIRLKGIDKAFDIRKASEKELYALEAAKQERTDRQRQEAQDARESARQFEIKKQEFAIKMKTEYARELTDDQLWEMARQKDPLSRVAAESEQARRKRRHR